MPKKVKHQTGQKRRLRRRLFDAGNTKCPICLSEFTDADVAAGEMTLEHAPPAKLKGSAICLTCKQCNNNASHMDQHAVLAKRARHEWSLGQGARVEVDLFGYKTSSRYIPGDPTAPLPTRGKHLRKGSIHLGALPPKELLDINKKISFRIPGLPHYEAVSLIKSAYLMVFSLMGEGGYRFAENVALKPVREQILNPRKRILKGNFVVTGSIPETTQTTKQMVFLCHAARPPLWIIPMWDGKIVLLPCGGPEPIDEFVAPGDEIKIEYNQLTGWTICRFNESVRIIGSVSKESAIEDGALMGTTGIVPTDKGEWEWMVVYHYMGQYVALPSCPADENPGANTLRVTEMLGEDAVKGRGLNKSALTRLNLGEWSKDMTIHGVTEKTSSEPKTEES